MKAFEHSCIVVIVPECYDLKYSIKLFKDLGALALHLGNK